MQERKIQRRRQTSSEGYARLLCEHSPDRRPARMSLMRHTNFTTTTKYLRAMHERMKEAVSGPGATLGASQNTVPSQKSAENSIEAKMAELARILITQQNIYGKIGGGGRSRTVDAADMSRVL